MPNWDSKKGEHKPVVKEETKRKEQEARRLREEGNSYSEIGKKLGVSKPRAAEYNKGTKNGK